MEKNRRAQNILTILREKKQEIFCDKGMISD